MRDQLKDFLQAKPDYLKIIKRRIKNLSNLIFKQMNIN